MTASKLEALRARISELNRKLLEDLNERLRVVAQIRDLKHELGLPLYDPAREEEMLRELLVANPGPMTASQLQQVFKEVFGVSLAWMERRTGEALRIHRKPGEPDRELSVRGHRLGGGTPALIAGPCAVESEEQVRRVAQALQALGCRFLRGGAYKPRTNPYSFQGLGREGWQILRRVADELGMAVVSEALDPRHLDELALLVDVVQVGARNMYNYELLKELGQLGKPVLLKRGFMATLEEFVLAAEYVASHGNDSIVLCERGIRTFERWTRSTLDISAVPLLKEATPLPVVVDVAHAAGRRDLLVPLARAALAAGADGVMIEVHPSPPTAVSDAEHQLDLEGVAEFHRKVFASR